MEKEQDLLEALWLARRRAMMEFVGGSDRFLWLMDWDLFTRLKRTEEFFQQAVIRGKPTLWGIPIIVSSDVAGFEIVLKF